MWLERAGSGWRCNGFGQRCTGRTILSVNYRLSRFVNLRLLRGSLVGPPGRSSQTREIVNRTDIDPN
jgi:hypothetical protein